MKDIIFKKYKEDPYRFVNGRNFFQNFPNCYTQEIDNQIIVRGYSDQNWVYLYPKDTQKESNILSMLSDNDNYLVIENDQLFQDVNNQFDIDWVLQCEKLVLYPNKYSGIEDAISNEFPTSRLSVTDVDYIFNHYDYSNYTSPEYIKERIENGYSLCYRKNNTPIAWLMTHDDGAIGFLHVLPEFRRLGLATSLTNIAIKDFLDKGEIPFVHIESTNKKSLNVAKKIGFEFHSNIYWVKIKH